MIAVQADAARDAPESAQVRELAKALHSERRLLDTLLALVRRQRAAIAGDNLQEIEDCVHATHRVLITLREARRQRCTLYRLMGWSEGLRLGELEEALGGRMTPDTREARDELCATARELTREVEVNRAVLRRALTVDGEYAALLAGVDSDCRYAAGGAGGPARAYLFDQRG